MKPIRSIIVEGVDRLGKDTLIRGLLERLGFMQVVHYQKPLLLKKHLDDAHHSAVMVTKSEDDLKRDALKAYQAASFESMFNMLKSDAKLILNRAHLGEVVYSPRYRGYDGSYVYEQEERLCPLDEVLLVLIHTSDFSFIADDGASFDFEKKEEEQLDFVRAWERSKIKYKVMLDVSSCCAFVPPGALSAGIAQAFQTIQTMNHPVWHMHWEKKEDGSYLQVNDLTPDPRTLVS